MNEMTSVPALARQTEPLRWYWYAIIGAVVFAVCLFGVTLTLTEGRIASIWLSNGVLAAILLRSCAAGRPMSERALILGVGYAGNAAANVLVGDPLLIAFVLPIANLVEIAICTIPLLALRLQMDFARPRVLTAFCVLSLTYAPAISGVFAAGFLSLIGDSSFREVFGVWYPADALGLLIVTPILMTVDIEDLREALRPRMLPRLAIVVTVLIAALTLVFLQSRFPFLFFVFPALLFASFQLGFLGAALGIVLTAIVSYLATNAGLGPLLLSHADMRTTLVILQVFVATTALESLVVAAVLSERKKLQMRLFEALHAAEGSAASLEKAQARTVAALGSAKKASEAKTDFLASMSHEIRTPLNSIIGFTGLVLDNEKISKEARRQLLLSQSSAQSLLTIVNDILDFSKIEAGRIDLDPRSFAIEAAIDHTVSIVSESAKGKGLELAVEFDKSIPAWLYGDDTRIGQVLLNLLNNAIKFTEHGAVRLQVTHEGHSAAGETIRFAISDSGIGIPADKIGLLFRRFSQVDSTVQRRFGGTGLGLAICKRLVELMGGEIGVESTLGEGSTFWFRLALPKGEAKQEDRLPERRAEIRPMDILLVEDLPMNQEIATAHLTRAGHRVRTANNGEEALEILKTGQFDLILMDVQMPVMDGITATRHIRESDGPSARTPIIAMTANVMSDQIRLFKRMGMNDHVGKPFAKQDLLRVVEQWSPKRPQHEEESEMQTEAENEQEAFDQQTFEELRDLLDQERVERHLSTFEAMLTDLYADGDDREALAKAAHKLKSVAGMLGFMRVSARANDLEQACDGAGEVDPALDRLKQAGDEASERVQRLRVA